MTVAFFVSRGQKIRFSGTDGPARARRYAEEFGNACEVDGDTVIFVRETNISRNDLTMRDVFGAAAPFGTNGHHREPMPTRGKRALPRS